MEISVRGMRVLITGAGGGAGREIAQTFAQEGARVWACDVRGDALDDLRAESSGIGTSLCDVGDPGAVDAMFDAALPVLGGLDVLVNNVGIAGPTAAAEDVGIEAWDTVIRTNLSGFFYCCRRAIPALKAVGGGSIINVSSTSARTGLPLRLPYAVSKVGVMGLTQNLARELGPFGIRVNTILPGWIDNERGSAVVRAKAAELGVPEEELVREMAGFISMRTRIQPVELARMMLFLVSPLGAHVSGQQIGVCGNVEYER
jgi:NAD(P)-dependent dehydrogenase (short-subunit alcohol dehydrogenase family)